MEYATLKLAGAATGIAVLFWLLVSLRAANQPIIAQRETLAMRLVMLEIQASELERKAALASAPDLSRYEFAIKKQTGIATAYSCGGLTSDDEINMNCPSLKNHPTGLTAAGTIPATGRTMACEPRLLGKTVLVSFGGANDAYKAFKCEDTGNRITSDRFDIYLANVTEARQFGVKNVTYVVQ